MKSHPAHLIARVTAPALAIGIALFLVFEPPKTRAELQHNPGRNCANCHADLKIGGSIFADSNATQGQAAVPVSAISEDGSEIPMGVTDASGNIASSDSPQGHFLFRVGKIMSRTWHELPGQGMCNGCHVKGGNVSAGKNKQFPPLHSRIPADDNCSNCHHFPASMTFSELATAGVLDNSSVPPTPRSQVEIPGHGVLAFDPAAQPISTVRPDVFATGYFSMFDAILAVAKAGNIPIEYHYDESRKTHFIDKIDGFAADYWYHFSYDADGGNSQEIQYRRANRWDELLWRPGAWIKVVRIAAGQEDLNEIKNEYREEIDRENANGHMIPSVQITIATKAFRGNPLGSGRIQFQRRFNNVQVSAHGTRSMDYPSPYAKPFQPGVVTALDVLLSLQDQGFLDLVTTVHYSYFSQHYIDSQYVVALGIPGVGTAHSSGYHGFIYVTENGTPNRLPNNADGKLHVTSDVLVIHAPDFTTWTWADGIGPGVPYYESAEPAAGLPGDNDRLCVPLPDNQDLLTGVAVVNKNTAAAATNWLAWDDSGTLMTATQPAVNPGRTVIPKKGQLARLVPELFGGSLPKSGGWLEALGDEPGMSGFFMLFDGGLKTIDGVDISGRRVSQFILPEAPENQVVDVVMMNSGQSVADVSLKLRDKDGKEVASAHSVVAPKQKYSVRLRDLFGNSVWGADSYLEVGSSAPLAALERFGVPGVDFAMLNALDLTGGSHQIYAPQYVHSAVYHSAASILNLEEVPTVLAISWIRSDGRLIGRMQISLPAKGRATLANPGLFGVTVPPEGLEGYLQVNSSATRIAGSVRFGDPADSRFQTSLPLVSTGQTEAVFGQVADDPATWFTGVAVVNPDQGAARITVEVYDPHGIRVGSVGSRTIPAGARISELLSQIIPDLPVMSRGYFRLISDRPVFSFAIFGTRSLSALAAIPPSTAR